MATMFNDWLMRRMMSGVSGIRTIWWNQLYNPDGNNNVFSLSYFTYNNNVINFQESNSSGNVYGRFSQTQNQTGITVGDKVLIKIEVFCETQSTINPYFGIGFTPGINSTSGARRDLSWPPNQWNKLAYIDTIASGSTTFMFCTANEASNGYWMKQGGPHKFTVKNTQIFDLTKMFGAGREPTSVAEFESMFPDPWYPYNPGEEIVI